MYVTATTFNLSASVLLAALIIVPQMAGSAKAGATDNLLKCKYNSRQQTINCCEHILKTNQRPQWMSSGGSCTAAVKCVGGKQKYLTFAANFKPKCFVQIPTYDNQRSSTVIEPRQPNRGQNSTKD